MENVTGGEETEESLRVMAYPNPANNELTVRFEEIRAERARYKVVDAYGKVVASVNDFDIQRGEEIQVEINDLSAGIYYIQVDTKFKTRLLRVVKLD